MTASFMRAGAIAAATTLFAASFGTIAEGANAQDPGADQLPQAIEYNATTATEASATRFVASPVVQQVSEEPEVEDAIVLPPADVANLRELVARTPTDATLTGEMKCLAQAVYFESRGEPLAGQLAVARVVINRAKSNVFPDSYCRVVTQRAQFSFVRGGRIPEPNLASTAWQRAKAIATIADADLWSSDVGDALYFHATHVRPSWANRKVARATIDSHVFYR